MIVYGLYGMTHGAARVLTVMCDEGASAALARMPPGEDLGVVTGAGRLTQYHEKRAGALERLVEAHGIVVLGKAQWDRRKRELGERIWR